MNFFLAIFAYLVMAVILIAGIILAFKGIFWVLIFGLLAFVLAMTKLSILHH